MRISEQLIYCTTKIISVLDDDTCATGTGFFMSFNIDKENNQCQPVIITNKHVVEGAKKIIYSVCKSTEDNTPLDQERFEITFKNWKIIKHPDDNVDLCAISISSVDNFTKSNNVHLFRGHFGTDLLIDDEEIKGCSAIEDVVMVGYPIGLEDSYNNKPIVRKGITATHMKYDYEGKKEFLVDISCFPGSSGSPVFLCNESTYTVGHNVYVGDRCRLLGVLYAGPKYNAVGNIVFENIPIKPQSKVPIPTNLGVVIKASRIKELEDIMKNME